MSYRILNTNLFVSAGAGRFENVSSDGITTEIIINPPYYNTNNYQLNLEQKAKNETTKLGIQEQGGLNGGGFFVHKKDINRATIFGVSGFKSSIFWEDDYQITITDNFESFDAYQKNGIFYAVKVRTYSNKSEGTFEALEGRRYYMRQLVQKFISTAVVYDVKY
jgi:hypothetical protein